MDREELYDKMANRKSKPKDFQPYSGDNGRVNKCVELMRSGVLRTGGTLLDVGGGIGDLGYAVRDLYSRTIVFDIAPKNLEAAAAKGNYTILGDIDKTGIEGRDSGDGVVDLTSQVDTVTALDFIEHIVDPEHFARECYRVLKPGGEVFINTPNIRFWRHIEKLLYEGKFPHTSGDREVYHGGHLAFFTYSDVCEIFESAGFVSSLQIKDNECFETPPPKFLALFPQCKTQAEYVAMMLEFGCPNMLYKATK